MSVSNAEPDAPLTSASSSEPQSPSTPLEGDALLAWLHLANVPLVPRLANAVLAHFNGDPQRVFDAADSEFDEIIGFQARHLVRLRDPLTLPTDRQVAWMMKQNVWLALRGQPAYPEALEVLTDPPPMLFVRGTLESGDSRSVGMVGSRHATPYGRSVAERFARELAEQGVTVISGGAVGIDASSHRGALSGGGRTLAFLGCGLDVDYPRENRSLFEQIREHGAMISENPLGAQPEAWRFPARNRLISAMSLGVLVVEAPKQSGALITARFAAEQNRIVMAIPGNIDRPTSVGCNDLLKEGAALITETIDVLRAVDLLPVSTGAQGILELRERRATLESVPNDSSDHEASNEVTTPDLSALIAALPPTRQRLMECLTQTPQHVDMIAQMADMSSTDAGIEMLFLELEGFVRRLPGNTYIRAFA